MAAVAFGPENFEDQGKALAKPLLATVRKVEKRLNVQLDPHEVEKRGKQAFAVLVHELLHAGMAKALPELANPEDFVSDAANELFVRILEDEICREPGLPRHTPTEHVQEMARLFPGFALTAAQYRNSQGFGASDSQKARTFRVSVVAFLPP